MNNSLWDEQDYVSLSQVCKAFKRAFPITKVYTPVRFALINKKNEPGKAYAKSLKLRFKAEADALAREKLL